MGSDLHDGPAQLIGLALLKLDHCGAEGDDSKRHQVRTALTQAVRELRDIAAGLLLPEIDGLPLEACVRTMVANHEANTGTKVALTCSRLPAESPERLKVCVCRFIQEGLANSFRHGGGLRQRVRVDGSGGFIRVTVADSGPGIRPAVSPDGGTRLGLSGLRGRLQSMNGTLTVSSQPQRGTRLVARLPLITEKANAG